MFRSEDLILKMLQDKITSIVKLQEESTITGQLLSQRINQSYYDLCHKIHTKSKQQIIESRPDVSSMFKSAKFIIKWKLKLT